MKGNKSGTRRRATILAFLRKNAKESPAGPSPSIEEIQQEVGLKSKGATAYQLRVLREMGLIEWEPGKPRTIKVIEVMDAQPGEPDEA